MYLIKCPMCRNVNKYEQIIKCYNLEKECSICLEVKQDIVSFKCGHTCTCISCTHNIAIEQLDIIPNITSENKVLTRTSFLNYTKNVVILDLLSSMCEEVTTLTKLRDYLLMTQIILPEINNNGDIKYKVIDDLNNRLPFFCSDSRDYCSLRMIVEKLCNECSQLESIKRKFKIV